MKTMNRFAGATGGIAGRGRRAQRGARLVGGRGPARTPVAARPRQTPARTLTISTWNVRRGPS
jgi:hypothetical protein